MRHAIAATRVALSIAGVGLAEQSSAGANSKRVFLVGVCAHFGQDKGISERNLQMMQAAGIESLRDELSWAAVERKRGAYSLPPDKSATFQRASALGIAPMLIFDDANRHYDGGDRPRSPEALDGYASYAAALVRHFGPDVRWYEVWNEYDIGMPRPF
jgi:hypothetical protein